jgi:hypothetical protein
MGFLAILASAAAAGGCAKKVPGSDEQNLLMGSGNTGSVGAAIAVLNAPMDEVSNALLANADTAAAACAVRAQSLKCKDRERTATYQSCLLSTAGVRLQGTVSLQYTEVRTPDCDLGQQFPTGGAPAAGEIMTRIPDLTWTSFLGGSLKVTAESHEDWRGYTYSGGSRLTSTAAAGSFRYEVLGLRRTFVSAAGESRQDFSFRTLSPVDVTGGLTRGSRRMDQGLLEVSNNTTKTVITYRPNSLFWGSTTCCYPTGGTVTVTKTTEEGKTYFSTLSFTGCGSAKLTQTEERDGEKNETLLFPSCE